MTTTSMSSDPCLPIVPPGVKPSQFYIPASLAANSTLNPIRAIVDTIIVPKATAEKQLIPLSIGDPTIFGNLKVPEILEESMKAAISSGQYNGYAPSTGAIAARQAVAARYSYPNTKFYSHLAQYNLPGNGELSVNDVLLCSGCSGALTIVIECLLNVGENLLIPRPGFSLYATICGRNQINYKYYNLLAEKNWEIDLTQLESLIDSKTRAILINNPSNPNGSNFSLQHIQALLKLAEKYRLPIIADEVYADMVFSGNTFFPLAAVSENVPIISVGGIAKQFVCPGYRLGWILLYEKGHNCKAIRDGMNSLSQIILGPNTLVQAAVPDLLMKTPKTYYTKLIQTLEHQALFLHNSITQIAGLSAIKPAGAMYIMVRIDFSQFTGFSNDSEFAQLLLNEEFLFVLPGTCFQSPGFIRLVITAPLHILQDAIKRLQEFCHRHTNSAHSNQRTTAVIHNNNNNNNSTL
jgi:tyrosine aminotransferase